MTVDIPARTKKVIFGGLLFVLGVVATIIIEKLADRVSPDDPIIIKQYADTIAIVHDYQIPDDLENDSTRKELEKKIRNLELLNNYDKQIKDRIKAIEKSTPITPNLILTQKLGALTHKGFVQESSSSYFTSTCPDLSSQFIDIKLDFINNNISKDIAYLRLNIYRYMTLESKQSNLYVLEDFYEVKESNNLIRINNDLNKGKYDIMFGFILESDLNKEYPRYFLKKCVLTKQ